MKDNYVMIRDLDNWDKDCILQETKQKFSKNNIILTDEKLLILNKYSMENYFFNFDTISKISWYEDKTQEEFLEYFFNFIDKKNWLWEKDYKWNKWSRDLDEERKHIEDTIKSSFADVIWQARWHNIAKVMYWYLNGIDLDNNQKNQKLQNWELEEDFIEKYISLSENDFDDIVWFLDNHSFFADRKK